MKGDLTLEALQKLYGNVIHYESFPANNKNEVYFFNVEIFKRPLFVFHVLRKIAIFFDRLANRIRNIIYINTVVKERLKFKTKI